MDYTTMKGKELTKICRERKIKYAAKMRKQEMIEVLQLNDQDNTVKIHLSARKRITDYTNKYRDNEKQREKANDGERITLRKQENIEKN